MQPGIPFRVEFNYKGDNILAAVSIIRQDDTTIFKVKFPSTQYVLIHAGKQWLVVSDFKPCKKFKQTIVSILSRYLVSQNGNAIIHLA